MSHVVDLTGMDFGYLHVIGRDTSKKGDTAHWICRCKCGTICSKDGRYLRNGHAKSCGCFRKERAATLVTKKNPAKKPKAEPKKKKFGRGPQWASFASRFGIFRVSVWHVLHCERPCFAMRKAMFCNAKCGIWSNKSYAPFLTRRISTDCKNTLRIAYFSQIFPSWKRNV